MALSSIDLLNEMRSNASAEYQDRIPVATQENLATIGSLLTSVGFEATYNEWLGLVGKIALTIFSSRSYSNPLKRLKKGRLPLGQTLEEIFVQMAKATEFDPEGTNPFERRLPEGVTLYHSNDFFHTYSKSISRAQVISSFQSEGTLDRFFVEVVNALYSGYEQDEYLMTKKLILDEARNGYVIACPTPDDPDSSREFVRILRQKVMDLGFVSNEYNPLGALTFTPKDRLILFIDTATYARIGVDVLASAFNIGQVDWDVRIIPLDGLDGAEGLEATPFAILCDSDAVKIYDKQIFMDRAHNAQGAFDTLYLHVNELIGWSHVGNIITFIPSETATEPVHTGAVTATWSDGENYLLTDEDGYRPHVEAGALSDVEIYVRAGTLPSSVSITATPSGVTASYASGVITLSGTLNEGENIELTCTVS